MFVVHQISMNMIQVELGGIGPTQNLLYTVRWWNQGMGGVFLEVEEFFLTRRSWVGREMELSQPFLETIIYVKAKLEY